MDFFQSQDSARRRTAVLLVAYAIAVIVLAVSVYILAAALAIPVLAAVYFFKDWYDLANAYTPPPLPGIWNPALFFPIAGATVLVMLAATLYRARQVRRGGAFVAELLGGHRVNPHSRNPHDRRLLNVVAEMAIASGTPVPAVYVLRGTEGINAFAAGLTPGDAAIAVTEGCLGVLTRDELQGAVAHEFSHILNGDMRIKTRVLCILYGISFVETLCAWPFRALARAIAKGSAWTGPALVLFAVTAWFSIPLLLVSQVGLAMARTIKGAVSRQREFLADSAAVQFTRNPMAVTGVLKKVGGLTAGARVLGAHVEQASHFFLAAATGKPILELRLLASHPPLAERVRRLDPAFAGEFQFIPSRPFTYREILDEEKRHAESSRAMHEGATGVSPEQVMIDIGAPRPEHLAYAAALLEAIPAPLLDATRDLVGARAVIYALLLSQVPVTRRDQYRCLDEGAAPQAAAQARELAPALSTTRRECRLPLAELAIATLKDIPEQDYRRFADSVERLTVADEKIDLFEYALYRMMSRHLAPAFAPSETAAPRKRRMESLLPACARLLACLAAWGTYERMNREEAFAKAAAQLAPGTPMTMPAGATRDVAVLDAALDEVAQSTVMLRRHILHACVTCVAADGRVSVEEATVLQAVADALDCPMPPILPGVEIG